MNKYCPKCGTCNDANAGYCLKCGEKFPSQQENYNPTQNYQGSVPPQQPVYQTPQSGQMNFIIIQQLSQKIKNAAIFWMVFGILEVIGAMIIIISGAVVNNASGYNLSYYYYYDHNPGTGAIVYGSLVLAVAIVNIAYAIIHFAYAKTIITNPTAIIIKIQSPVLYIISIVINTINLIGIIGGIMMLSARTMAKNNQFVFHNNMPNHNVPPYAPQHNPGQQMPVQPPVQPSAPQHNVEQQMPVQPPIQPSTPVQTPIDAPDIKEASEPVEAVKTENNETNIPHTTDTEDNNSN